MNPAAYAIPAPYTFGNLGRNTLIGPGFAQLDFGGYKNFRFTERFGYAVPSRDLQHHEPR